MIRTRKWRNAMLVALLAPAAALAQDIVVGMLFIGLFGMASSFLVKAVGARLTPWYRLEGRTP